tara:strand:- start:834 stop:1952 length:1119 start_codon:yes stop_codon:yes gene_type:complete
MIQFFVSLLIIIQVLICKGDPIHPPKIGSSHPIENSYRLVWHDEFIGNRLDRSKWAPVDDSKIGKYGHGNGEAQAYLDAEGDTFFVKNGMLNIRAQYAPSVKYPLRDTPNGKVKKMIEHQDFRSAKLTTENLHSFTYGIFEARIKNPTNDEGIQTAIPVWPAFWLMPEDKTAPYSGYWDKKSLNLKQEWAKSKWPYSGEIDIMEMSGRATRLYHAGAVYHKSKEKITVGNIGWYSHYRRYDGKINPKQWLADQKLDPSLQPKNEQESYVSDFHIYGCKWTKDKLIFMFNGKEWGPGLNLKDSSIFGGKKIYQGYPFYLILNLAIGGNYFGVWGPNDKGPDKKNKNELYDFSLFPQSMLIDWVRVYSRDNEVK